MQRFNNSLQFGKVTEKKRRMAVVCHECRESNEFGLLLRVIGENPNSSVFNLAILHTTFCGSLTNCLSVILSLMSKSSGHTVILSSPDTWMNTPQDEIPSFGGLVESDSDDSDIGSSEVGKTGWIDSLFSLVNYFRVFNKTNKLVILFNGSIPRKLRGVLPLPEVPATSNTCEIVLQERSFDLSSSMCICVQGSPGSGKTSMLKKIAIPTVWIYTHELINCELGASVGIVRQYFSKAAKLGAAVVFDDADLTLNTSGKIVREIVEELGACLSEFKGKVFFVFSLSLAPLDALLMSRVDQIIDLG